MGKKYSKPKDQHRSSFNPDDTLEGETINITPRHSPVQDGRSTASRPLYPKSKSKTFHFRRASKKATAKTMDIYRQEISTNDHKLSLEELEFKYRTSLTEGLPRELAARMLVKYGRNELEAVATRSMFLVFLNYMFGGFAAILWGSLALSVIAFSINYTIHPDQLDEMYLSIVLFVILVGTGVFGFIQEYKNSKLIDSFKKMVPKTATVIRGGVLSNVSVEEIVPGDLIRLEGGDVVPADLRIIESHSLKVDNSSITGESEPQTRCVNATDDNPLETGNLAFFSTNVIEGGGKGIVIATGQATLIGHIATLTSGLAPESTPMKQEVKRFIKFITIYAICVSSLVTILGLSMGKEGFEMFIYFIGLLVANIPEALLVTITACLTLMAKRMSNKNCMVRNMHAVETLGQTNVICSDKTGTLTQNRMTVSHMYYDNNIFDVLSPTYVNGTTYNYLYLCRCAILCSRATFKEAQRTIPVMQRAVLGDASETAVLKCMELLTRNTKKTRKEFPKIFEIPFNSANKYQLSIHKRPNDDYLLLVLKGAPERVIDRCSSVMIEEHELPLLDSERKRLVNILMELGYMGERVLAFADLKLPSEYTADYEFSDMINFPVTGLRFVGFMSLIDPPRPGVREAVAKCKRAGISVVMVTGDHPVTAMSIARKVGIISPENDTVQDIAKRRKISVSQVIPQEVQACKACVIPGYDMRKMTAGELDEIVQRYEELVFARTSPQQKLQIVEAYQKTGKIVAVTGDGVNDSPALKKADIGIAMGICGSDVSKDAADLVLLDDNFASIVMGIEEGRIIYDNLKKSIAYILTSNIPEVVPFVIYLMLGTPRIITVIAVLILDVGTDLWPGISLAYEPAESDIMDRPPRDPKFDNLVGMKLILFCYLNIGTLQTFGSLASYFFTMAEYGFLWDRLINIQDEWYSESNAIYDSYNVEWTHEDRMTLERMGVSAYFLALVVTQISDCLISKTRRLSLAQHGFTNGVMIKGLLFEVLLSAFVVYCPYINVKLGFHPVNCYVVMCPVLPFAVLIFIYDEIRKYIIRQNPDGWFYRNTYY